MSLDRHHLEVLRALADHPTLRAAATSINISPSAASRRLAEAEARVGATLTKAEGRTLVLTPAGRHVAKAGREAQRLLAEAESTARWIDRGAVRPTRLGFAFHDSLSWVLDPAAAVEVARTTERTWPSDVANGTVDVVVDAVADAAEAAPGLARHPLCEDRLVAVVAPGHPLHTRNARVDGPDLADLTYFAASVEPRPGFEFECLFRPSGATPRHIVIVESNTVALDLISRGAGVSIQPALSTGERTDVVLLELTTPIPVTWFAHTRPDPSADIGAVVSRAAHRMLSRSTDPGSVP